MNLDGYDVAGLLKQMNGLVGKAKSDLNVLKKDYDKPEIEEIQEAISEFDEKLAEVNKLFPQVVKATSNKR